MLEVAIALVGIVAFMYLLLNTWQWLTASIAQRQVAFLETRREAGRIETAGRPVPYVTPPIQLMGPPGSGGSLDPWDITLPPPPCTAAVPFFEQAAAKLEEARALQRETEALNGPIEEAQRRVEVLSTMVGCFSTGRKEVRDTCFVTPTGNELKCSEAVDTELCFHDDDGNPSREGSLEECLEDNLEACIDECGCTLGDPTCTYCDPNHPARSLCNTPLSNLRCSNRQLERANEDLRVLVEQLKEKADAIRSKFFEVRDLIAQGNAACPEAD